MARWIGAVLPLVLVALPSAAESQRPTEDWCDDRWYGDRDRAECCEVRETTLPVRDVLDIDAGPNGGITVRAWDRNEILVQAKVQSYADTPDEARDLATAVRLHMEGTLRADGPRTSREQHWAVSFRVFVPRRIDLRLETTNGGIGIYDVTGQISFSATNGGVHLEGLNGDVRGRTTNGGLHIELTGGEWNGQGMDVRTTNGGVRMVIPPSYSARLETGTTNGHLRVDFPITVQGRIDRRISVDLGNGGRLVRAVTTNGGVVIQKG